MSLSGVLKIRNAIERGDYNEALELVNREKDDKSSIMLGIYAKANRPGKGLVVGEGVKKHGL